MTKNKESVLFTARILSLILGENAPVIFDRSAASFKKWLASERGVAASEKLQSIIEEELEKLDSVKFLDQLNDYAFLFPKNHRDLALEAYNETGKIEVKILRDDTSAKVSINRIGSGNPLEVHSMSFLDQSDRVDPIQVPAPVQSQPIQPSQPIHPPSYDTKHPRLAMIEEDLAAMGLTMRNGSIAVCMASNRGIEPHAHHSILGQFRVADLLFGHRNVTEILVVNTNIMRARNVVAQKFLETGFEWSFWVDDDMINPTGNPKWYKDLYETSGKPCNYPLEMLKLNALAHLTRGKHKFVSAVYPTREKSRRVVCAHGMSPKSKGELDMMDLVKKGPQHGTFPDRWVGFGCVAVHRDVFLAIQKNHPECAPKGKDQPWEFFTGNMDVSEDVAFCNRANDSGHQLYVDTSIFSLHIGKLVYTL